MEQQRSMMMSRAMSQRSVVIRPATQETGGMMQYLLTIIFLICTFWVVVGALYFFYNKKPPKTTTEEDFTDPRPSSSCPGTIDQPKPELLPGKTIVCSVRHDSAANLWVYLPEGVCSAFVALGLTRPDGTIREGLALSVERLSSVDRIKALVSVDYSTVSANSAKFANSLKMFLDKPTASFKRLFDGIEVRGITIADYQDNGKMTALNKAISDVKGVAPKVQRVIATLTVPPESSVPAQSSSLTNVDTLFVLIHNLPVSGGCTAQPPNSLERTTQALSAMSGWNKVCLSILLGAVLFRGAGSVGASATECVPYAFCKAKTAPGSPNPIPEADSVWKKVGSDLVIYDTPQAIRIKASKLRDKGCIYVDHIELDDRNCTCQKSAQFVLLSEVRKGMS